MGPFASEALSRYRSCEPGPSLRNKETVAASYKDYNITERHC